MYCCIIYFTELLIVEYCIWRYLLKKTCQKLEGLDADLEHTIPGKDGTMLKKS